MKTKKHIGLVLLTGLVVGLAILAGQGSADMVQFKDYTLDLGSYTLPIGDNHINHTFSWMDELGNPINSNTTGGYSERLAWTFNSSGLVETVITLVHAPIGETAKDSDLLPTLRVYLAKASVGNDIIANTEASAIKKPYLGWVTGTRLPTSQMLLSYIGKVDNKTILLYFTTDEPEKAMYWLGQIKVVPESDAGNVIAKKVAEYLQ